MQKLTGSYIWHYVDNEDRVEGLEESHQYLVCFESEKNTASVWEMRLTYWFEKGAKITIHDSDGTPHDFRIDKDGFYILDDLGSGRPPRCFRLHGVKYWTAIPGPGVNPDDILTVV